MALWDAPQIKFASLWPRLIRLILMVSLLGVVSFVIDYSIYILSSTFKF
jgi:hypothetical protein